MADWDWRDQQIMSSGNPSLMLERIQAIYQNRGLPVPANAGQLAQQVASGALTFNQLRNTPGAYGVEAPTAIPATGGSGKASLRAALERWGLGGLTDRLWGEAGVQDLQGPALDQFIRTQPEYKQRFGVIEERVRAGLPWMSEAEVLNYETQARAFMRAAGLPEGFYDQPDDFKTLLLGDVSLNELNQRVSLAKQATYDFDPAVVGELQRLYGVTQGDLVAFALDEKRALPLVQRRFEAGQVAGASVRTGYGQLDLGEAEHLAQLGVSPGDAQTGFSTLARSGELFGVLPGEAGQAITRQQQLGAQFEGNAVAQDAIAKRRRQRQAQFEGGGGFASSSQGVSGLGSANL